MSTSTPAAQDDFSMRNMLDQTMKDFGVTPPPLLSAPAPVDTAKPPMIGRTERIVAIVAIVFAVIAAIALNRPNTAAPDAQAPAPAALLPTPIPQPPSPEPAMLPAFAAPNGAELGEIEATRAITPTAHYGSEWIQADVQGSGRIWLRTSDFPSLAIVGPDLAPKPTATARPYVSPTPEPQPPCHTAGTGGQTVTVCDWLSQPELETAAAAKWAATYGGTIGSGDIHPTPQEWNKP